ncbi:thiol-disulfide oxidoreductase DCC family protein [Hugenholtzia roseola]|uniref:thiol-disulfide oxidoreductase DCC family protein n=1 Tax=Hugenholtzia roseola TaxID=1002 RepID=UPI000418F180|nr:thiol-disulfide oxidoreductase DCC family protein [Hugenholtzia roseola]
MSALNPADTIVFFDGVCNLCNGAVNFIIDRNPSGSLRFASLQSDLGKQLLDSQGLDTKSYSSLILYENGTVYRRSTAALRIASHLSGIWSWARVFLAVPPFLRDGVYDLIARNRYRWFGKTDACRLPTPELRVRFLG